MNIRVFKLSFVFLFLFALLTQSYTVKAAEGVLTGSFGSDCKSFTVTSSGFDDTDYVQVEWYDKNQVILGTKQVKINSTENISFSVQPAGVHYRVYNQNGDYVTPLKDQSSACVVLSAGSAAIQLDAFDCNNNLIDVAMPYTARTHFNWDATNQYDNIVNDSVNANTGAEIFNKKIGKTAEVTVSYQLPEGYKLVSEENLSYTNTTQGLTKIVIKKDNCSPPVPQKITGTFGPDCKTFIIDTSGYAATDYVLVEWYDGQGNIIGTKKVPVNSVQTVDMVKQPNGVHYRVYHENGDAVTPLLDQAAACVIITPTSAAIQLEAYDCNNQPVSIDVNYTAITHFVWDTTNTYDTLIKDTVSSNSEAEVFNNKIGKTAEITVSYELPPGYKVITEENLKYTGVTQGLTKIIIQQNECTPTTEQPSTEVPSTEVPTTEKPSTEAPTTEQPTTEKPTTEQATTEKPTTEKPSTEKPTTEVPTTEKLSTEKPTTEVPTTEKPSTEKPTTEVPTTEKPSTEKPTTEVPTTEKPTTEGPTTEKPTTEQPSTEVPTTEVPTTEKPSTEKPTTEVPTTEKPTTEQPTTEKPTTEGPTTEKPTTEQPSTEVPTTEKPTTEQPTTEAPTTEKPTTEQPTTEAPTTEKPSTEKPTIEVPTAEVPTTEKPSTEIQPPVVPPAGNKPSVTEESPGPIPSSPTIPNKKKDQSVPPVNKIVPVIPENTDLPDTGETAFTRLLGVMILIVSSLLLASSRRKIGHRK